MAVKLRRPVLLGGIGLSFSLWFLQSIHDSVAQLSEIGVLGAVALGTGFWFFQQKTSKAIEFSADSSPIDRETVEVAIAQAERIINQLESEADNPESCTQLRQHVAQLTTELDRQEIQLAVTGGKGVGKTSLIQVLESTWMPQQQQSLRLKETPPLFVSTDTDVEAEAVTKEIACGSDLVLLSLRVI